MPAIAFLLLITTPTANKLHTEAWSVRVLIYQWLLNFYSLQQTNHSETWSVRPRVIHNLQQSRLPSTEPGERNIGGCSQALKFVSSIIACRGKHVSFRVYTVQSGQCEAWGTSKPTLVREKGPKMRSVSQKLAFLKKN
jgi:hypothetical protein